MEQFWYFVITVILWVMAWLMRMRKLDILIARYESFQKIFRKDSFIIDNDGIISYYTAIFFAGGFLPLSYLLIDSSSVFLWITMFLFGMLIVGLLYLQITTRYLIFQNTET
ncbi:MAG: hypothetical protein INQ03_20055 [Candidatus Heimdallarchaeota archaeon]|nr:hypothetical protein [Candidatus Heimdallarchaeota archaeon]